MDVAAWLQGLGLERYVPAFRDNEIDWDALPQLSTEDLKDLGVVLGAIAAGCWVRLPRSAPRCPLTREERHRAMRRLPPMPNGAS